MEGVVVHMVIGLILFTPIGFITALYQHRKAESKAKEEEQKRLNEQGFS
ncbi:MAG: hypothetical protein WCK84_03010 [Bacteroidota bacterium]|jgi:hypothetical protein